MPDRTPSQTAGPFFSFGLCVLPAADLSSPDAPETITIEGRVLDGAGEGIHDALVEIWQADAGGEYRRDVMERRWVVKESTDGAGRKVPSPAL